jgi:hypothetical protein
VTQAQELFGSIRVELPEDPRQSARAIADVAMAWATMLEAIGLEVEAPLSLNETRTRGGRRPPKPKLVIGLPPKGDAA